MKQSLHTVLVSAMTTLGMIALFLVVSSAIAAPTQAPPSGNPSFPLKGLTGATGPTGPTGPAGPAGPTGPAGTGLAPALQVVVNDWNQGTTYYRCTEVNLVDICGDADGCSYRLLLDHKLAPDDEVRIIDGEIYQEYAGPNSNTSGATGWTRQDGGDYKWITGNGLYTVFDPWAWAWMFTYKHNYCYGSNQNVPAHTFGLMAHPHVRATYQFFD